MGKMEIATTDMRKKVEEVEAMNQPPITVMTFKDTYEELRRRGCKITKGRLRSIIKAYPQTVVPCGSRKLYIVFDTLLDVIAPKSSKFEKGA